MTNKTFKIVKVNGDGDPEGTVVRGLDTIELEEVEAPADILERKTNQIADWIDRNFEEGGCKWMAINLLVAGCDPERLPK